jgi:hypothetical protein
MQREDKEHPSWSLCPASGLLHWLAEVRSLPAQHKQLTFSLLTKYCI